MSVILDEVKKNAPDIFEKQLVVKLIKHNPIHSDPQKFGPVLY